MKNKQKKFNEFYEFLIENFLISMEDETWRGWKCVIAFFELLQYIKEVNLILQPPWKSHTLLIGLGKSSFSSTTLFFNCWIIATLKELR